MRDENQFRAAESRIAKLESRIEDLEGVLREIVVGKRLEDNQHPLGELASMTLRWHSLAQKVLER